MILVPMLYELIMIFPMFDSVSNFSIILMHMMFASGMWLLYARTGKFKLGDINMYLLGFLLAIAVPVMYTFMVIVPVFTDAVSLIYLLMHVVFAGGFITLYAHFKELKKLA